MSNDHGKDASTESSVELSDLHHQPSSQLPSSRIAEMRDMLFQRSDLGSDEKLAELESSLVNTPGDQGVKSTSDQNRLDTKKRPANSTEIISKRNDPHFVEQVTIACAPAGAETLQCINNGATAKLVRERPRNRVAVGQAKRKASAAKSRRPAKTTVRQVEKENRQIRMRAERIERQRLLSEMEQRKNAALKKRTEERLRKLEDKKHQKRNKEQEKEQIRELKELQSLKDGFLKAEHRRQAQLAKWREGEEERERAALIRRWMSDAGIPMMTAQTASTDSSRRNSRRTGLSPRYIVDAQRRSTIEQLCRLSPVPYDIVNDPRMNLNKESIIALAKRHKLSSHGTKIELVRRIHEYYDCMAGPNLRFFLKGHGLSATGRKDQLLHAIACFETDSFKEKAGSY